MGRKMYPKSFKQEICEQYKSGKTISQLMQEYDLPKTTIWNWLNKNNIPRQRFNQEYIFYSNYAEIAIKTNGIIIYTLIDLEDIEKCQQIGIWSITKDGYIINCKNKIYLHRFVMNAPSNVEVDHIYHNLLDNRKSQLRFATSSQQKMNTKTRKDNTSGCRGVYFDKSRNTWNVNVTYQGRRFSKRYKTYEEAVEAAINFRKNNFKEFQYQDNGAI